MFQLVPFDIKLSFIFYIVLVPEKSSNTLSDIVYSAVVAKSIIIATASNNPNSFLTTLKPFFYLVIRQEVSIEKLDSIIVLY